MDGGSSFKPNINIPVIVSDDFILDSLRNYFESDGTSLCNEIQSIIKNFLKTMINGVLTDMVTNQIIPDDHFWDLVAIIYNDLIKIISQSKFHHPHDPNKIYQLGDFCALIFKGGNVMKYINDDFFKKIIEYLPLEMIDKDCVKYFKDKAKVNFRRSDIDFTLIVNYNDSRLDDLLLYSLLDSIEKLKKSILKQFDSYKTNFLPHFNPIDKVVTKKLINEKINHFKEKMFLKLTSQYDQSKQSKIKLVNEYIDRFICSTIDIPTIGNKLKPPVNMIIDVLGDFPDDDVTDIENLDESSRELPICEHGTHCQQENQQHFLDYSHPANHPKSKHLKKFLITPCPYGEICSIQDHSHYLECSHPESHSMSKIIPNFIISEDDEEYEIKPQNKDKVMNMELEETKQESETVGKDDEFTCEDDYMYSQYIDPDVTILPNQNIKILMLSNKVSNTPLYWQKNNKLTFLASNNTKFLGLMSRKTKQSVMEETSDFCLLRLFYKFNLNRKKKYPLRYTRGELIDLSINWPDDYFGWHFYQNPVENSDSYSVTLKNQREFSFIGYSLNYLIGELCDIIFGLHAENIAITTTYKFSKRLYRVFFLSYINLLSLFSVGDVLTLTGYLLDRITTIGSPLFFIKTILTNRPPILSRQRSRSFKDLASEYLVSQSMRPNKMINEMLELNYLYVFRNLFAIYSRRPLDEFNDCDSILIQEFIEITRNLNSLLRNIEPSIILI